MAAKRVASLWAGDGLTAYAAMTFDTFHGRKAERLQRADLISLSAAKKIAWDFALNPTGLLVLVGANGVGKTHLAAAIANQVVKSRSVIFTGVVALLDHLREGFSSDSFSDRFDAAKNVGLLVLDDLGAENGTSWANERLFAIIDWRYVNSTPTVITTNVPVAKMPPRIASRLSDSRSGKVVEMEAPDIRPHLDRYATALF